MTMKIKQEIIIRQMEPKDFAEVAALENENWTLIETPVKLESTPEHYVQNLEQGVRRFFLAVEATSDEIFGVITVLDKHKNLEAGKFILSFAPMVVRSARGQGLGKFIIDFVLELAKDEGYKKVSIEVLSTNQSAIKLYESAGFIKEGQEINEFFIDGKWVDNLIYAYFIKEDVA